MARGEQIDRIHKLYFKGKRDSDRYAKKEHSRFIRRQSKNIDLPHPQHNRYRGWTS